MIKSKEQLRRIANGVANQIKEDIRKRIVEFMEAMGTDEMELADALDITVEELDEIMGGTCEIPLTTFAKLIVASEHTIEIKPCAKVNAPFNRMSKPSTQRQRTRPQMNDGEAIPSYEEFQRMVAEGKIPPPPRGMRMGHMPPHMPPFMGNERMEAPTVNPRQMRQTPMHRQEMGGNELDSMSRRDLVNTVMTNGWDNEIDLLNATRSDIIEFLIEKGFHTEEQAVEQPTNTVQSDKVGKMAAALAEVLQNNPQLASILEKYV